MVGIDWLVLLIYFAAILALGLWKARRASKSMANFFVAGRSLPWWIAGTSMLATSFASDTPLHVTKQIRELGLGGAWFYWEGIVGGVAIAFVFSRMWQRTGVVTDAELIELRYHGRPAAILRGAQGAFRGIVLELITLSWVTAGMVKIVHTILGLPDQVTLLGATVATDLLVVLLLIGCGLAYSVASGLWGVVMADLLEFALALVGAVILGVIAVGKVGGTAGLREGLVAAGHPHALEFFPSLGDAGVPAIAIGVYLGVQWWASPYVDGSGQRAQRFLACKDPGQALLAGVWNMSVQYVIRSWPWYTAALASLILYPTLADPETAYPRMITELLPAGLRGLMVASMFAAFMSTFTGLSNLSASYLANDVYRRFLARGKDERHYVRASRLCSLGVAVVAGFVALQIPSILEAFRFKMELMCGLGAAALLRWFWWRVNAKTELVALCSSIVTALALRLTPLAENGAAPAATRFLIVAMVSLAATVLTALFTRPEPNEKLVAFFRRVRPPAALWGPIPELAARVGPCEASPITIKTLLHWAMCVVFIFSAMFGIGKLVLGESGLGLGLLGLAAGLFYLLWRMILKTAAQAGSGFAADDADQTAPTSS
ncbi:MAG: Na+:solute symporter [Deltaproteobacteria bacterium]|nr:Na+:solute symporter [Deltaproteobacteria bacterium]